MPRIEAAPNKNTNLEGTQAPFTGFLSKERRSNAGMRDAFGVLFFFWYVFLTVMGNLLVCDARGVKSDIKTANQAMPRNNKKRDVMFSQTISNFLKTKGN